MTKLLKATPLCAGWLLLSSSLQAGSVVKADVPDNLDLGISWVGGTAPGASDIAVWDHTVQTYTNWNPGAPLTWSGIQVLDPLNSVFINDDGNTLTLGADGIDLNRAEHGLVLNNLLALGAAQTWAVTNGQALRTYGVISGAGPLTLAGEGTITLGATNTFSEGVVINGSVVEPVGGAFGSSSGSVALNDGATLLFNHYPNGSILHNPNTVAGTIVLDLSNRGISVVLDGSWAGGGTILVTNLASGATLTLGGNGTGGDMNNFTGTVIIADTNSDGTASAGSLRFNNGGSSHNVGNAGAVFNLGQGAAQFTEKNGGVTTYFGALIGGPGTRLAKNENYVIGGANLDTTFAGTIQSSSSLNKVGTGTFTLTGNNPYTGTTTISDGTLQIGDGVTPGTGSLGTGSVINNATLVFSRPDDFEVDNTISGTGTAIKASTNVLTYGGTDTASGAFLINQGTLALNSAGTISSSIAIAAGATFDVTGNPSYVLGSTLSGFGTVQGTLTAGAGGLLNPGDLGAAGTLTFASGLTEQGGLTHRFEISAPGSTNDQIAVTGDLNLSGLNSIIVGPFRHKTIATGTYPLITYTGNLVGDLNNLQLSISGALGVLTILPGQIAVVVSPPPRGATNLVWVGDGVANTWDIYTSTNWVNGSTPFTFLNGDRVTFDDTGIANPTVNLAETVLPASVTVSAAGDYTFAGDGEINGAARLIKTNGGTLTILTTNSYTGPTTIGGGTVAVVDLENGALPSSLGAADSDPTNLVFSGGSLSYVGAGAATDRGATLNDAGATVAVTDSNANLTLNGTLVGSGALVVSGPGRLTIGAPNTYSGGTVISNGVLALGNNTANSSGLGATNGQVTFLGGTLQLDGYTGSTGSHYSTPYNPLVVPAGQTGTLRMFARGPTDSTGLAAPLMGSGTLNLVVNYLRDNLNGDWSAFSGLINVTPKPSGSGDEMRIGNSYGYANATIYLNDGVLLDRGPGSSSTVLIGALGGTGGAVLGRGNKSSANPTWSVGWNNTSSTYSGAIQDDGVTSFIKTGTGKLTFNGGLETYTTINGLGDTITNTLYTNMIVYSGSTTISNGTLALVVPTALDHASTITLAGPTAVLDATQMGSVSNQLDSDGVTITNQILETNGLFEVLAGQTLSGLGTILASNVVLDGSSTLDVGLPVGTLAMDHRVELAGAVNMNLDASGTPNCSALVSPTILVDPSATLTVNNLGPEAGATFHLFSQPVDFAYVNLPPLSGTNTWVNNLAVDGSITLVAPPLPVVKTNATNITVSFDAGTATLNLQWPADHIGWRLQVQTNSLANGIGTNWVDVAGSSTTNEASLSVNAGNGAVFYRMVYP